MSEVTGKAKGGKARAEKLTSEERSEIARKGGLARWTQKEDEEIPRATHAGELSIGDLILPCSVFETKEGKTVRLISARGITAAFTGKAATGGRSDGGRKLPRFLGPKAVNQLISQEVMAAILNPIEYYPPHGGRSAYGYEATLLPEICEVILDANRAGVLKDSSQAIVAEMLLRGFARVGIIALVDEVTGYQETREKDELSRILAVYLAGERLRWAKFFPVEFYKEVYRLNGWSWPPAQKNKYTPLVGKYTNDVVYERLPFGVLDKLKELNPTDPQTKRRKWKFTQFLSEDFGQPDLRNHLLQSIALMRASTSWKSFLVLLDRALPKGKETPLSSLGE